MGNKLGGRKCRKKKQKKSSGTNLVAIIVFGYKAMIVHIMAFAIAALKRNQAFHGLTLNEP